MIYIHVPFCRSFCTYCGFYSEICGNGAAIDAYASSLCDEAIARREEIALTREVNTLYVGGGTPSVLPLDVLRRIVEAVGDPTGADFEEFTIEVNPEDIVEKGEDYVRGLLSLGVNRVSMGVQSLDDGILKWMNRRHDAVHALKAIEILKKGGVKNLSLDLMFGLPQLPILVWEKTLSDFINLEPQHISAYQLSIEPESALALLEESGRWKPASEDQCAEQYDALCRMLGESGYHHYEVSNFAKVGFEAKHNGAYWKRVPYVGLGPGAHSLSMQGFGLRSWNTQELSRYRRESEILTEEQARVETIMLSLRTDRGLNADWLRANSDLSALDRLLRKHSLVMEGESIRIPEDHFFVSDEILREII